MLEMEGNAGIFQGCPNLHVPTPSRAPSRPLGALLDNAMAGYDYNPVSWEAVMGRAPGGTWQPLAWPGPGPAPPLITPDLVAPKPPPAGTPQRM